MNPLQFKNLRRVNRARVGHFKNRAGEPAHTTRDGSDWNFGQWMEALVGEIGEACEVRLAYENGSIDFNEYMIKMSKELADIQIYLDLLAMRAADQVDTFSIDIDHGYGSMQIMSCLGMYFESRKKFNRRDITLDELCDRGRPLLMRAVSKIATLLDSADEINTPVTRVDDGGIDLGWATVDKFNEVSIRVGSPTRLHPQTGASMEQTDDGTWHPLLG